METKLNKEESIDFNNEKESKIQNENKNILDSHSDSKIITELKKIENADKKEQINNDLSKSLSEINSNNSDEDKKSFSIKSITDSNNNFNRPKSKKIIVEIEQLSQRVSKEENENETNNRKMMKELRLKYFSNKKKIKNIEKKIANIHEKDIPQKTVNNNLKPLEDLFAIKNNKNNKLKNQNNFEIKIDNKANKDKTKKFFVNLLKEENNFNENKYIISKDKLLKLSDDQEKLIYLLDKNKELLNFLRDLSEKYRILKSEYIELYKYSNSLNDNNYNHENDEYKKYLVNENEILKKKLDKYEKIFPSMVYYINDISIEFNLKKINYPELKKYINNLNEAQTNDDNKNYSVFVINILNENKKKIFKGKKIENDEMKNMNKLLNKIRSHSNFKENEKILLKNHKNNKIQMKKLYNKY